MRTQNYFTNSIPFHDRKHFKKKKLTKNRREFFKYNKVSIKIPHLLSYSNVKDRNLSPKIYNELRKSVLITCSQKIVLGMYNEEQVRR